jgi:hypothetical protein
MRVAGHHLVADRADNIGKAEEAGLFGHPGVVDGLEQKVAQLAPQLVPGLAFDGVGDLMRLFQRVGRDGGKALHDVPGAAGGGVAQAGHDLDQAVDPGLRLMHQARFPRSRRRSVIAATVIFRFDQRLDQAPEESRPCPS